MNTKQILQISIGGALVFRDNRGKRQWMIVKQKEDGDWEVPKVTVRKGESSVRSVIRMTAEQAGMSVKVLEEAGRYSGSTILNGKSVPQKHYYYLMAQKSGGADIMGFDQFKWVEYGDAFKKISTKKEKEMLKAGRDVLKEWEKTHNRKQIVF